MADIQTQDNSGLINAILGAISNKTTDANQSSAGTTSNTSSGSTTTTTKGNLTPEAINKMLTDALSAAGTGVADIAMGAHSSGIYDSTAQTQLTGNLISGIVGELAKAQAGTTTTTDTSKSDSGTTTNNATGSTNTKAPIGNISLGALAGAGGLGLLASVLGPSLGVAGSTASGAGGLLAEWLKGVIGGSGDNGFTGDAGAAVVDSPSLNTGNLTNPTIVPTDTVDNSFQDFLSSIGIGAGTDTGPGTSGDDYSWWDPAWGG